MSNWYVMSYNWLWCSQKSQSFIWKSRWFDFLLCAFQCNTTFHLNHNICNCTAFGEWFIIICFFLKAQWYSHLGCFTHTALVMFWLTSWNQRFFYLNSSVFWRQFMIAIHKIKKNILPRKQKGKQEMIVEKSSEISSICLIKSPPLKMK